MPADGSPTGVLLVDKPEGPTSFDVVAKLRRALKTRAIGHCGTLDPLATGLLVVVVGNFTRLSNLLTADDKEYVATIAFGARTSTDDREGEVVETGDASRVDGAALRATLPSMEGAQMQVPPAYSAISVGGERLYEKARRGEDVVAAARPVVVHALELLDFGARGLDGAGQGPVARVRVACGKGFYVRSFARDLGARLGVPAHLAALRRTASGAYHVDDAAPLSRLVDEEGLARARLLVGPAAIRGVPLVGIDPNAAAALRHGRRPPAPAAFAGTGVAHVGDDVVAIVEVREGALRVVRGL